MYNGFTLLLQVIDDIWMGRRKEYTKSEKTWNYVRWSCTSFFLDEKRIEKIDFEHSNTEEERIKVLGMVHKVVVVIYTERYENIRVISARFAEKDEIDEYYRNYDFRWDKKIATLVEKEKKRNGRF